MTDICRESGGELQFIEIGGTANEIHAFLRAYNSFSSNPNSLQPLYFTGYGNI